MKNKGFGLIQLLITVFILGIIGTLAYKSYFGAGQKNLEESAKAYENTVPEQPAAVNNGAKPESVHTRKAKEVEGRVFINTVVTAERAHEAVNGGFLYTGWTSANRGLGVSTAGNQYFKEFCVEKKAGGGFIVKVKGSGELEGVILASE
jgi:Tfp pilus assembly protein PilE